MNECEETLREMADLTSQATYVTRKRARAAAFALRIIKAAKEVAKRGHRASCIRAGVQPDHLSTCKCDCGYDELVKALEE
jgi:hypothetical protein